MISINNISMRYGARVLFDDVTTTFMAGRRYAITGPNGIMGYAALWEVLQERETLYAKPHDELTDADGMRLGELEGIVGEEGGYTAEADAAILLDGLDVPSELHERKMSELQGGQKVRVLLAQGDLGILPDHDAGNVRNVGAQRADVAVAFHEDLDVEVEQPNRP